jgi:glutaminase
MIIIPGVAGIVTYSPKLNEYGISVKGIEFC